LARTYARLSARTQDLVLDYPWEQDERYEIDLPSAWSLKETPEPRAFDSPFGAFSMTLERGGTHLAISIHLKVPRHRIAPADYSVFRRFLLAVDAALDQPIGVGP